ncbi:MAG TPA: right-handed parallel beta-helix repeat-containing protein [Chthoniobacteraceae bacterium]|nr:right-handed parallel beta-helix repeat-containing protein [Chthoniobacteraceae bacterium]
MKRLFQAVLLLGLLLPLFSLRTSAAKTGKTPEPVFVSPGAAPDGEGTRERPLPTLARAIERLSGSGGEIVLLAGIYREVIEIPPAEAGERQPAPLLIRAEPGAKVIFDGGRSDIDWKPWGEKKGLFAATLPGVRPGGIGIWEIRHRVRYRESADAAGVEQFPGSYAILPDSTVVVHLRTGAAPREVGLKTSPGERGLTIGRAGTTVSGILFRNYLGSRKIAPVVIAADGVELRDCTLQNSTSGVLIQPQVEKARVTGCLMRDVGTGIYNLGNDTVITGCIMEAARGAFAIEAQQHVRNGIRCYHPARGALIQECITAGFWAGLYIKTISADLTQARPVIVRHNLFTDGIKAGSGAGTTQPQPLNHYVGNLIGPNEEGQDMLTLLPAIKATVESNYFSGLKRSATAADGSNRAGASPFADLAGGDLTLRDGVKLPEYRGRPAGASLRSIRWVPEIAAVLEPASTPDEGRFRLVEKPICASSAQGAMITVTLSDKARGTLRYRKRGSGPWSEIAGVSQTPTFDADNPIMVPTWEPAPPRRVRLVFALLKGELEADREYEYQIQCTGPGGESIVTEPHPFKTSGGPKTIHVRSGEKQEGEDGSPQRPFTDLQMALDHALPGDTVQLAQGVYSRPAIVPYGGTASAPLVIRGAGADKTILDGAKLVPVLLELREVEQVRITDLQIRWFGRYGIYLNNAPSITIERCLFRNLPVGPAMSPNGMGIRLEGSPGATVSHSIFTANEYGIDAIRSPGITIRHNTGFLNLYAAVRLISSARGSELTHNSFTFTGNDSLSIDEPDPDALAALKCDFNNYGAWLRDDTAPVRPENDFRPAARYAGTGALKSKHMIRLRAGTSGAWKYFTRMEEWRRFSGQDAHSLFEDPQYTEPLRGDFRLLPGSPNRLADGKVIGATGRP